MDLEQLKYPLGQFEAPLTIDGPTREKWIEAIESLPQRLTVQVESLTDEQLDTPYRPAGWTVRQLVHHIADSHMNAFMRFRLALTEDRPTIKPYNEKKWANLSDASLPVHISLNILEGLHQRWTFFLKRLTSEELSKSFYHPETQASFTLDETIGTYAHHGDNHLAQIVNLKMRENW